MTSDVEFLPATQPLVMRFYGGYPKCRMRGYVAVLNDEPIAVGGVCYPGTVPVAF